MSLNLVTNNKKPSWTEVRLEQLSNGVDIIIKQPDGNEYYLLKVKNDGTFYRYEGFGISEFQTDASGRIRESKTEN